MESQPNNKIEAALASMPLKKPSNELDRRMQTLFASEGKLQLLQQEAPAVKSKINWLYLSAAAAMLLAIPLLHFTAFHEPANETVLSAAKNQESQKTPVSQQIVKSPEREVSTAPLQFVSQVKTQHLHKQAIHGTPLTTDNGLQVIPVIYPIEEEKTITDPETGNTIIIRKRRSNIEYVPVNCF